jgi:hypothetical protein
MTAPGTTLEKNMFITPPPPPPVNRFTFNSPPSSRCALFISCYPLIVISFTATVHHRITYYTIHYSLLHFSLLIIKEAFYGKH